MRRLFTLMILMAIAILPAVMAISIGVSPGVISLNDLLRDGYAEKTVTISSSISEDVNAHFEVAGEVADWLSFEPESHNFVISKDKPYVLKIIVRPPADAPVRVHTGEMSFITDSIASVDSGIGSSMRAAILTRIEFEITDQQIIKCRGGGLSFVDTEEGMPLYFRTNILNDGNVMLEPVFEVEIWDQERKNIVYSDNLSGRAVSPTTQSSYEVEVPNNLKIGQYWVNIILRTADPAERGCWVSDFSTFSVYEKGSISDKGILENVSAKVWANVGEIIEITATFRNTGERSVDAKFTGTITNNDKISGLLESETLRVAPGESVKMVTYFTPQEIGRFTVAGRVLYNNKLTFEKGTIINVTAEEQKVSGLSRLIPIMIYILIFLIIIFLIFRIRKERNRRR